MLTLSMIGLVAFVTYIAGFLGGWVVRSLFEPRDVPPKPLPRR